MTNGESAIIDSVSAGSISLCVSVLNNNIKGFMMSCVIKKLLQLSLDGTSNYCIALYFGDRQFQIKISIIKTTNH